MLKKILFIFFNFILGLIALALLLVAVVVFKPNWVINKSNLQWAQSKFFPEFQIPWTDLDLRLLREGSGQYSFYFSGQDFCQDLDDYGNACFKEVLIDLLITTNFRTVQAVEFNNFTIKDKDISITLPPSPEEEPKEEMDLTGLTTSLESVEFYLKRIHFKTYELELGNTSISTADTAFQIYLKSHPEFHFQVKQTSGLELDLVGTLSRGKESLDLASTVQMTFGKVDLNSRLFSIDETYFAENNFKFIPAQPSLKKSLKHLSGDLNFELTSQNFIAKSHSLDIGLNIDPLRSVQIPLCELKVALSLEENIPLQCKVIQVHFDIHRLDLKGLKSRFSDFPKRIDFSLSSAIPHSWLKEPPAESGDALQVSVKADPLTHPLFTLNFEAQTGVLLTADGMALNDPDLQFLLEVPKFQSLVSRLENSRFAIPAPFHVMTGSLRAEVKEVPKASRENLTLPFTVSSNLASERNRVIGDVNGVFNYSFKGAPPALDVNVELDQFHIQLPPFDPLRGFPPLAPDTRISETLEPQKEEKNKEPAMNMTLHLKTKRPDSIRVYQELISPYASFGLDVKVKDDVDFEISKSPEPFQITYLNRTVTLQNFSLEKEATVNQIVVDGVLLYKAAEYDVFIRFAGPTDKPKVLLTSEPPLDRRDIISVLLYNRVTSETASFEQENVGGAEAAMADQAIGLFGIWAFASTPIEAVSYNPVSGTYSAQIKLPEGFRLSVGTDWESVQNLELRRRLTENWMIMTTYRPQSETGRDSSEVMLQRRISY